MGLWLFYALSYLDSGITIDTARDFYQAEQIRTGASWVLQGPVLANAIHLSGWWFYWLSLPNAFESISLVAVWVGLSAGFKFLLAYVLAVKWLDRRYAWCVVFAMTLPGWHTLEHFTFTHINVVQTLVFAFLLLLWRLWQTRDGRWLKWLAWVYTLALHAHPSTYGLLLFASPFLAWLLWHRCFSLKHIGLTLVFVALVLLPYAIQQQMDGWPDFYTASAFGERHWSLHRLMDVPCLWYSMLVDAPMLYGDVLFSPHGWWGRVVQALHPLVLIISLSGVVVGLSTKRIKATQLCLLFWLFASLSIAVLYVRDVTPFYMTYVLAPAVALFIGLGLWGLLSVLGVAHRMHLGFLPVTMMLVTWYGVHHLSMNGRHVLPSQQLGHVLADRPQHWRASSVRIDYVSVRAANALGGYACNHQSQQLHGPIVPLLDAAFGTYMQHQCPVEQVQVSGNQSGYALLGATLHQSLRGHGYDFQEVAGFALLDSVTPLKAVNFSLVTPNEYNNAPRPVDRSTDHVRIERTLPADSLVVVTDYLSFYRSVSEPVVQVNGKKHLPLAQNHTTRVYACVDCPQGSQDWTIDVANANSDSLDVVYATVLSKKQYVDETRG